MCWFLYREFKTIKLTNPVKETSHTPRRTFSSFERYYLKGRYTYKYIYLLAGPYSWFRSRNKFKQPDLELRTGTTVQSHRGSAFGLTLLSPGLDRRPRTSSPFPHHWTPALVWPTTSHSFPLSTPWPISVTIKRLNYEACWSVPRVIEKWN